MEFDPKRFYESLTTVPSALREIKFEESIPQIRSEDVDAGVITRYFTRQANHQTGYIYEVNKGTYAKLKVNPLYATVELLWRIAGPLDDVIGPQDVNTPTRLSTGVITANTLAIRHAEATLPGLSQRLPNPSQYYVVIK